MSQPLDEEVLESLSYERSKIWSNFLTSCAKKMDDIEIDTDKIEEFFKDESEQDYTFEGEEAEESNVEDDMHNATQCMSKAELTLILNKGDNKEILDHTMPIVEEHVRKWKEAGLDRILNTFDAEKIEQHVGDWLRRHNSAYGDKTLLQMSTKKCHKRYKTVDQIFASSCSEQSDAESMHSVETARYIRDSRKRTSIKCRSPMTTIKMYRTLPRKRAELRAKYACHEFNEEQEHRHHMQSLIQRRKQLHRRQRERDLIYHTSPRHYPYMRKRRDLTVGYASSSSSEEEQLPSRCACSPCARTVSSKSVYPYYSYHSYHSRSRSHSHSHSYRDYHHEKQRLELGSRSMASLVHFKHSVRQLRRQHGFEDDLRPHLVENECSCCNNERLCSKVVHLANSSTDNWVVENKSSPDPEQFETPKRGKTINKILKKTPAKKVEETPKPTVNMPKTKSKAAVTFAQVEANPTASFKPPSTAKKSTAKTKTATNAKKEKLPTANENKAENKTKQPTDRKLNKTKELKSEKKPKIPSKMKQNRKRQQISTSSESDDDLKKALALSQETYVAEMDKLKLSMELEKKDNTTLQTVFNNHSVACNSTALNNDTACSRALQTKNVNKANTSNNIIDLCSSSSLRTPSEVDGDCTLVTSTTGCEAAKERAPLKISKKGVLLHEPASISSSNNNNANANFTLTEQILSPIIGQRRARKFLKYYTGSCNFDSRYYVYYRPPGRLLAALSGDTKSLDLDSSSSSGSEDDIFEIVDRYGVIHTMLEKSSEHC